MPEPAKSKKTGGRPPVCDGQAILMVSARDKDRVLSACDNPRPPSDSVRRAAERYRAAFS